MRQTASSTSERDAPEKTALTTKSAAVTSIVRVRPQRSATSPVPQAPATHPSNAEETVRPIATSPASNCSASAATVPLITAVSNPKRKPPSAAAAATSALRAAGEAAAIELEHAGTVPRRREASGPRSAYGVILRR